MNRLEKIEKDLEKAREKAAECQAKVRELEKQKQEEENSQIVQAVRSMKLTPGFPKQPEGHPCRFGPDWPEVR